MKLIEGRLPGPVRSGFLAAMLCTVCGLANAAFTYVQLGCQGASPQEVIVVGGGSASDSCATSGGLEAYGNVWGTFTAAGGGFADMKTGSWEASVTYDHQVEAGVGVGPFVYAQVGAIENLTFSAPAGIAGTFSFTSTATRVFGFGADPGLSAGVAWGYSISLGQDVCALIDSGSCTVSIAVAAGAVVAAPYSWGGSTQAGAFGSGQLGSAFAFDPGAFELQAVTFRDNAGNLVSGASIQSESGTQYLTPVPEPETWALMLAGQGLLTMMVWRRRRRAE